MKILVTGGSRGIGAELVRRFASEGNTVSFIYNKSDTHAGKLALETGAQAIKADVGHTEALAMAVKAAEMKMGGIDVLVNNAGLSFVGLLGDSTDDIVQRLMSVNLTAAIVASREVSRYMINNKYGRIINIGSVWGRVGASCETVYSASKAGLEGLTKALAKELGPSGITVNCVEPGVIKTEMLSCFDKDTLDTLSEETPLCRLGKTSDVAEAVLWLASDKASFITGQILGVDGGFGL